MTIDTPDIPEAGKDFFAKAMLSYGPPIPLSKGPGGSLKIKRGGTGKISNSGNEKRRFHAACNTIYRNHKKPGKRDGGTLIPKPPRARVIWDPTDPFILAYRQAHYAPTAAWRDDSQPQVIMHAEPTPEDIRRDARKRKARAERRRNFDFNTSKYRSEHAESATSVT